VIAISIDATDTSETFVAKLGLSFPLLSDPKMTAIRAYGVEHVGKDIAHPASFVIKQDGTIAYRYVGENPKDRPSVDDLLAQIKAATRP